MLRRILHRFLRLTPRATPPPPAGPMAIAGNAAAALLAAGAVKLTPPRLGGDAADGSRATVTLAAVGAPDTRLLAVVAVVAARDGPARLRLLRADGAVADELHCPPGTGHCALTLFAAPEPGLTLEIVAEGPSARMHCDSVALWALGPRAVDPAALVPNVALAPDPHWTRAYGLPDALDTAARLRVRAFVLMDRPALVTLLDDVKLFLEPGDELSRALLISGLYEPETLLAVRALLPPGGVCVDVGAHCGMVTAFAARCVGPQGRVLAFEPSPREFARLQGNVAAGGLAQVTTRQAAVAEAEGVVTLRLAEAGHAGHNTIGSAFAYEGVAVAELAQVPATTLDAALASLESCDLIKMDIEGAELRALRGGAAVLARLRPTLILEVFDRAMAGSGDTEAELFAWLAEHGYAARDIDPATGRFDAPAGPSPGVSRNIVAVPVR